MAEDPKFEISREAAALIRDRGGCLWIWPSPDRWPYATTEPPGERREWTTYRQAGFVVHVDEAISPPERWDVTLPTDGGRLLDARWNGLDPHGAFGRLPVAGQPEQETAETAGWRSVPFQLFSGLAALVWVLGLVGISRSWFDAVPFIALCVALLVVLLVIAARRAWTWRRGRTEPG